MAGCATRPQAASSPHPAAPVDSVALACAESGPGGSASCPTSQALLLTPQLQTALHDLRRLGYVTEAKEASSGRVALTLATVAMSDQSPLAYHLEHFYRAYRSAYDLGDAVVLELVYEGKRVGFYTNQGLLLRRRGT